MTALTVVVPTRDRPEHLAACRASLEPQMLPGDTLLIVDSCSRIPVPGALRVDRQGASAARNAGWRAATTDVVAFVDDDCIATPTWRATLEPLLDQWVFVGGAIGVPESQAGLGHQLAVTPEEAVEHVVDADTEDVLCVSGNVAVHRSALEDVGGFDERLGPGTWFRAAEDKVLFDRLVEAGHVGLFAPQLLILHDQWRSRRELLRTDFGYGRGAGARAVLAGGARGRRLARQALWDHGMGPVTSDLLKGYEFGALAGVARAAGAVTGLVGARRRLL